MSVNPSKSEIDDRWIDRLVDGELSETERRMLLRKLDTEPDGWRRCALAFLEAQSWRAVFGGGGSVPRCEINPSIAGQSQFLQESPSPLVGAGWGGGDLAGDLPAEKHPSRRSRSFFAGTARAAVVLMAFGLGWAVGSGGMSGRDTPQHEPGNGNAEGLAQTAPTPVHPSSGDASVSSEPDDRAPRTENESKIAHEPALARTETILPEPVRKRLESQGYRIEPNRGFLTVGLRDGRRVAVPVEGVKVRYVGDRVY